MALRLLLQALHLCAQTSCLIGLLLQLRLSRGHLGTRSRQLLQCMR